MNNEMEILKYIRKEILTCEEFVHEMIAQACAEGDDTLAVQALCLDPYVNSIAQARNIWRDYREIYKEELTTFR